MYVAWEGRPHDCRKCIYISRRNPLFENVSQFTPASFLCLRAPCHKPHIQTPHFYSDPCNSSSHPPHPPPKMPSSEEQSALNLNNHVRSQHGCPALQWDDQLARNATQWAQHLANTVGHMQHSTSAERPNQVSVTSVDPFYLTFPPTLNPHLRARTCSGRGTATRRRRSTSRACRPGSTRRPSTSRARRSGRATSPPTATTRSVCGRARRTAASAGPRTQRAAPTSLAGTVRRATGQGRRLIDWESGDELEQVGEDGARGRMVVVFRVGLCGRIGFLKSIYTKL